MRRGIGHRLFSFGNRRNEASGRRPSKRSWQRRTQVETLEGRQVLAAVPVISEVLASNDRTIDDVDGDDSDYIELYNAGDDDMSLNRWYLTDNPNDLQKWRFPDVPLKAGEFLVVFASNKDRNDPAGELHTNFQLSTNGEYLALVQPDGRTIAHEFKPGFPRQIEDVSYGIPTGIELSPLVPVGADARILVPTNGSLDPTEPDVVTGTWLSPEFDDSGAGWTSGKTGIGYVPPNEAIVLGDSVAEFSGTQGKDGWSYGTWTKNFDSDKVYAASEFAAMADRFYNSATNTWDVGANGAPPATELTANGGHPASANAGGFFTHWAVRRWVSETTGDVTIQGTLGDTDPAGDGVVGRIFVNGKEVFQKLVNGTNETYQVTTAVAQGDLIDFVIDAGTADDQTGDATTFTAVVRGKPIRTLPEVALADSSSDWSRTGVQGTGNWYYGAYDQKGDADGIYQSSNFIQFPAGAWANARWQWPETGITTDVRSTSQQPFVNATTTHWSVRRWQSPVSGTISVQYDVSKATAAGDGLTARVFHNGQQVDFVQLAGTDTTGTTRTVTIRGVNQGDTIDFAIDALGPGVDPTKLDGADDRANVDIRIARVADIGELVTTDIRAAMQGVSSSAYIRIPFNVQSVGDLDRILLNIKYDDAFVAYINGHQVAAGNVPDTIKFDSTALAARTPEDATLVETIDLTNRRDLFVNGQNFLQIHAINASVNDDELLVVPELVIGTVVAQLDQARYFLAPTPGDHNGLGVSEVGPLVVDVDHTPNVPKSDQPIVVTADISKTFNDLRDVTLTYRVMYGDRTTVPMFDNGSNGDATANDGIYTATIPAGIAKPGEMVRWFVTAQDSQNIRTRFPAFTDPQDSEEFQGTVVEDPTAVSQLPVFHLFVESWNRATTAAGSRGSLFYDGEFYDNIFMNLHGQSSSGFPTTKKSINVDLPFDHRFRLRDDLARMKDLDLLTNFADKSKMRNTLGYEQLASTGGAHHLAFPVRLHRNGQFYAVYDFVEDADSNWLERLGYDGNNSLYKMYNSAESVASSEKKAGEPGTNTDLRDLIAATAPRVPAATKIDYVFDNVNLAQMANFMAGFVLTSNTDCCHKNYYAYRDSNGTGEWWYFPWDQDLSNGRVWGGFGLSYFDDTMYPEVALGIGSGNQVLSILYNQAPGFKDMFLRRVRTLIDNYVKPPGTPADQMTPEKRIAELYQMMKTDADQDNELNPARWGQTGFQTFDQAVQIMLKEYWEPRRKFLYEKLSQSDAGDAKVLVSGTPGATTGKYFVPTDNSLGLDWTKPGFADTAWASGPLGIGFETGASNYTDLIKTDLTNQLSGKTSLYVRVPFQVDDPTKITALSLRMKYEDGYVAYLNGTEISRKNLVQAEPTFDSTARSRVVTSATKFENVALGDYLNLLKPGENILAIHSINNSTASTDMFVLPELVEAFLTNSTGEIPPAQVGNPKIDFGDVEFAPVSGNQREEFIQLVNNNKASVDISGWKLTGAVQKTFDPGTVLVPGGKLYATPDAKAFRARTTGPSGGQRLFVQGNYENQLPNEGGMVQLVAADGSLVSEFRYQGTVSSLQDNLRITELMYNPLEPSTSELARDNSLISEDFEYVELTNISTTQTLDLTGTKLASGIEFDFSGSPKAQLAPGQHVVVVKNRDAFAIRYGESAQAHVAGVFAANTALRDSGERIQLIGGDGGVVVDFEYSDNDFQGWPMRADGHGSSLQIVDPRASYTDGSNWRASSEINGSPGRAGDAPVSGLVINEIRSQSVAPEVDHVEIYNPTAQVVIMQNYYLSDSSASQDAFRKYAIPPTTVAAGGYLIVTEQQFNAGGPIGFGLNGTEGDELYLTVGDGTKATHFVDGVAFGASVPGETFGRTPNGSGRLYPMITSTFADRNSPPRVGPVVISEVMYAPGEPSAAAVAAYPQINSDDLQFIEIHNPSSQAIALKDWRIRLGVDFDFAANAQLAAKQSVVVLSFDPADPVNAARTAAFRTHYGLNDSVVLMGGFVGQLSSQGDGIQLQRAGTPPANQPNLVPAWLEDEVLYDNVAPWPVIAARDSVSLQRSVPNAYGNSAASWVGGAPTPGSYSVTLVGDLNQDGSVNKLDVERLYAAVRAGETLGDLNNDSVVDQKDIQFMIVDVMHTTIGDVNLDGAFNSRDFVLLFQAAEFEDSIAGNSTYVDGDWNLDGDFTNADLVLAWQFGGYDSGQPSPVAAIGNLAAAVDGIFDEFTEFDWTAEEDAAENAEDDVFAL